MDTAEATDGLRPERLHAVIHAPPVMILYMVTISNGREFLHEPDAGTTTG